MLGIWTGMILGISFLEAPLKFQAPNITLNLGLGIGKLVFSALNKVEIIFSIILLFWLISQYKSLDFLTMFCLGIILLIIALQSLWLLPILNARVDNLLAGVEVVKTNHHLFYVAGEVLKVPLLIYGFIKVYNYE